MTYYLYKLKFDTPVRFGTDKTLSNLTTTAFTANADTLFSAVCNEWVDIYGAENLKYLIDAVNSGEFCISDLLPYLNHTDDSGEITDSEVYIPKPVIFMDGDVPKRTGEADSINKKKMKKVTHISVTKIRNYFDFIRFGGEMDFAMDKSGIFTEIHTTRVGISYNDEPLPYHVAAVSFKENAGLCFIIRVTADLKKMFDTVLDSLGTTGIGGKRSSGYGKFSRPEDEIELSEECPVYDSDEAIARMLSGEGQVNISLSCIFPAAEDIEIIRDERSFYQLILRKGFVYSKTYAGSNMKRKQMVMLKAGACFPRRLEGCLADAGLHGSHSVYRYGKGIFLGVNIS